MPDSMWKPGLSSKPYPLIQHYYSILTILQDGKQKHRYQYNRSHSIQSKSWTYRQKTLIITSGDKNHPCGASLCGSHKISLKDHVHRLPSMAQGWYPKLQSVAGVVAALVIVQAYLRSYHESDVSQTASLHVSTCYDHHYLQPGQAFIMLREVSCSYELASMVQHLPFQFHAFAYTVQGYLSANLLSFRQCAVRVYAHDNHYWYLRVVQNLTLLTGMITPQHTMLIYHIKP